MSDYFAQRMADAESRVRAGFDGLRVGAGMTDHPSQRAQNELASLATDWLRANGGMPRNTRGNYSIADKHADKPSFSNSPYRTAVRYASGKAGRRAVTPR